MLVEILRAVVYWVYLIVGQLGRIYSDECDECSLLRAEGNVISISTYILQASMNTNL